MTAPIGEVQEGIEILFHPFLRIVLKITVILKGNKTTRRNFCTGRMALSSSVCDGVSGRSTAWNS